jgi:hypothetical protein
VIDVRVTEEGMGHVVEVDPDGIHRVGEPTPSRSGDGSFRGKTFP